MKKSERILMKLSPSLYSYCIDEDGDFDSKPLVVFFSDWDRFDKHLKSFERDHTESPSKHINHSKYYWMIYLEFIRYNKELIEFKML